ncbi:MAG TPA: PA domain-containing protein [Pyrinomonadaceae bacterium]|nr:PA domain-containing protein [Pyrinomonadaceae bacterium]
MKRATLARLTAFAFALFVTAAASRDARAAATIIIQNADAADTGFNDPTPASPVGNNTGTTLGQQRLNAFQFAANIWGATLNSGVPITIRASWAPLSCTATSATLGQANSVGMFRNFNNAIPNTWYTGALANALAGTDLNPNAAEIEAQFNSNLGGAGCLGGTGFYLGLDGNHGADEDLVAVLMHEFAHGLGFLTFTNASTGAQSVGVPSIYDRFLLDASTGKSWPQMTNAERQASAVRAGGLVWTGAQTTNDLRGVLATPRVRVNSPSNVAGNYAVGTADFGPRPSATGTTANVAAASPSDGCAALANAGTVAGRIALVDRGACNFTVKVKNAQNAGAVGVIIVNNVASPLVIQMGGGDPTVNIPALMVSQADGDQIRSQLAVAVSATLLYDTAAPSGVDSQGRALMYAPSTVSPGSSVSHWDTSLAPNQLMEPANSGDLRHTVAISGDLTSSQLRDIGWSLNPIGDVSFFVRQHYLDFLNREPDTAGLDFWTNNVFACGLDQTCAEVRRINTSGAFFLSIEFQQTGSLVYKMNKAGFGNLPGKPVAVRRASFIADTRRVGSTPAQVVVGQGAWEAQLEANKQAFALDFVQRAAFQAAHGGQTAAQFADSLFANVGVTPTAQERDAAVAAFGAGGAAGQAAALRSVADSDSVTSKTRNEAFVLMQYFGYLQRDPDAAPEANLNFDGFNFWLGKLEEFRGNFVAAEMVKAFIASDEYRHRFGQ